MATRNFRYICDNVKAIPNADGKSTKYRVVGIPYGGPEFLGKKDLHGQYFDNVTDYGRDENGELLVKTLYVYYDHALRNSMKEAIGSATFLEETDDGLVYEIEVSKSNRYHDMLLALAEKKFLGVSSQPVQTSVEIDAKTQHIKRWHPAEISFTAMPANPLAVVEIMKSFDIGEDMIALYKTFAKDFEEVEETESTVDTEIEQPNTILDENSLSNEIEELFDDVETVEETPEVINQIKALTDLVTTLTAEVTALKAALADGNKEVIKHIIITQNGIKSFAGKVAKDVKFKIQQDVEEEAQMSEAEKEAQHALKTNTRLPGPKGR